MIGHIMPYTISKTHKPQYEYHIHPYTGKVTIYTPEKTTKIDTRKFAEQIREEVFPCLQTILHKTNPLNGDQKIPFFGHMINVAHDAVPGRVQRSGSILHVGAPPENATDLIKKFYREACLKEAKTIMAPMVNITEKTCKRITIADSFKHWGLCRGATTIELSWRLTMAPIGVLRYVAAHETAHLTHMDHSKAFWTLCDQLTDMRPKAEEWLSQHGEKLMYHGNMQKIHPFWSLEKTTTIGY